MEILNKTAILETQVKDLTNLVQTDRANPHQPSFHYSEDVDKLDPGKLHLRFENLTKTEREAFYANYGKFKTFKQMFTKDQLNTNCPHI